MPDYKELYLKLFRASEQAIHTHMTAQRECEELYISEQNAKLNVVSILPDNKKSTEDT